MIASHKLRKRNIYLNKLIAFQDTEPIKVVTGIRRCGKSSLLKLMAAHLRENGVNDEQIIEINFESYEFIKMTSDDLYQYVKERSLPGKRMYLFFDELQRMAGWIATSTSPAPTPTCFRRNIPPICPAAVWKSKCCRCRLQSLSISMVSLFKRSKARSAVRKSRQLMPTVPITSCVRFLTPICGTAACRVLQMSGWNRTRPLPCWTAFIRPLLCVIF